MTRICMNLERVGILLVLTLGSVRLKVHITASLPSGLEFVIACNAELIPITY